MTDELVPPPLPAPAARGAATGTAAPPRPCTGGGGGDGGGDDDDGWFVRRVVVEIKQRVGSIKVPPPFYDEVQLVTYCLMLGATAGDLVQCVRGPPPGPGPPTGLGGGAPVAAPDCEIHISRVTLDAPPMHHAARWHEYIRPRLYDFAGLVHLLRADKALRLEWILGDPIAKRAVLASRLPHLAGVR